mgnify:CR=1 FL=1|jgi:hypothetical protein|tara:strand:- start:2648 stop:2791 length:144 start_codon:yes stop_codon:yes gene_type:complete
MPKKRKLNSKNPKYQVQKPVEEQEKVERRLMCDIKEKGVKVYGVFKV